uniref:TIR domain-containing protein n=1 Tax=Eptatretus burgeri TaxID=7764 RepID=A0A8C4PXD6_EPTBU
YQRTPGPYHFRGYGGLHVLLLASNKIKYLHPKVFIDTPHLQELDVHDNKLSAIPDKLRYLEIGSPNAVTLQSQDFLNIAKAPLQELRLNSGGPLRNYSSGALAFFHGLQRFVSNISLDSDPIFLFEILTDLANSSVTEMILENVFQKLLQNVTTDIFYGLTRCKHLQNLTLIDFHLTDVLAENLIKNIYLSSITRFGLIRMPCNLMHIRHLKIIDLSDNLLIAEGLWWKECHYTTELRLNSYGPLRNYSSGALASFHGLQRFASNVFIDEQPQVLPNILNDLANTPIKELRMSNLFHFMQRNVSFDYFEGLASCKDLRNFTIMHFMLTEVLVVNIVKNLYLSSITNFNIIKSSYSNDHAVIFEGVPGVNRTSPLREFTLDTILHIKFSNPKFLLNFTLFPDLSQVRISGTTMNSLMCYLLLVRRLKIVDFSGNLLNGKGLWRTECNFSVVFPDTTHLILSHNKFSDLDLVSTRLHLMPSIHYVDLSYNAISEFSFCQWPSILHVLILSHNDASLSGPICHSPHLHILDMSHTLLKSLDNSFLSRVPAIKEGIRNLHSLKLGHNPYFCNCDLYWFCTTFEKNVLVDWPDMYRCSYPDNMAGGKVEAFHPHLVQCDTRILITVTTLITGITGALIVGLGYYFDAIWFIRMGWLWVWAKRRGYKKLDSNQTFRYHAFISYSENDSSWVNDCLVPTLESLESGLRLCIHDRDFTPGEWIVDNIIQCIEQSSKTIFVLSRNFVNSQWCHYELYFAHHRTMCEREDSLVLLLLEPLPTSSVPSKFCKLRSLLGKKTYLAWPSEEAKRAIFWRDWCADELDKEIDKMPAETGWTLGAGGGRDDGKKSR